MEKQYGKNHTELNTEKREHKRYQRQGSANATSRADIDWDLLPINSISVAMMLLTPTGILLNKAQNYDSIINISNYAHKANKVSHDKIVWTIIYFNKL